MRHVKQLMVSDRLAASLLAGCSDSNTPSTAPTSGGRTGTGTGGSTYHATFTTPGTYQYDCAVQGTMMTGTIVVR